MTRDMWVIRRAYRFEDLRQSGPFQGIESKIVVDGPKMFLPVFDTFEDAQKWMKPEDSASMVSVTIDNPTP